MTTEKEQLEAEIAQRDERIAELEAIVPIESELRAKAEQATTELERELAALKAQQPSAGVVLPEPLRRGDEGGSGEYGAAMIRGFNACLREVARLNPCRAQAVPDGEELKVLRAFYQCCASITDQLADSPKSALARLVEAVKDAAPSAHPEKD